MTNDDPQCLRDAIARQAGAVISLPSPAGLHHHKTRLLAAQEEGFWVICPAGDRDLIDELMASGQCVGLSVRGSETRVVSATMILQYRAGKGGDAASAGALLLAWPAEVKAIQRRADFRVTVYPGAGVAARVWHIPDFHYIREMPPRTSLLDVRLRNLSLGGMGVSYFLAPGAFEPKPEQRLRIVLAFDREELLIDGRVRHARPGEGGDLLLGVQFKKLDDAIEGRQTRAALTEIIGQLQRDEIRRGRTAEAA
jgi:c-di-GMP-binding flagellar brake protein YcgR